MAGEGFKPAAELGRRFYLARSQNCCLLGGMAAAMDYATTNFTSEKLRTYTTESSSASSSSATAAVFSSSTQVNAKNNESNRNSIRLDSLNSHNQGKQQFFDDTASAASPRSYSSAFPDVQASRWHEWLDVDWKKLGSCQSIWELFVSNPYQMPFAEGGVSPVDQLAHRVYVMQGSGPHKAEDAIYFISLVLFDEHCSFDFISGLNSSEVRFLLDMLIDLMSDTNPTVRYWAFKAAWRALHVYSDCITGAPTSILSNQRWKMASCRSWFDSEFFDLKHKTFKKQMVQTPVELRRSVSEAKDIDDHGLMSPRFGVNHSQQDPVLCGLQLAFANFALWSIIALTGKTLGGNGIGIEAWVAASDTQALWEIMLDQMQEPEEASLMCQQHLQIEACKVEPFGSPIAAPHLIVPVLSSIALLRDDASMRVFYLRSFNLLTVQSPNNLNALVATENWHALIFFVLVSTGQQQAKISSSEDQDLVKFCLNLISCGLSHCFHQYRNLGTQLITLTSHAMQVSQWDDQSRGLMRQIILSVIRQMQASGFWRTEDNPGWEACIELARFVIGFVFFTPFDNTNAEPTKKNSHSIKNSLSSSSASSSSSGKSHKERSNLSKQDAAATLRSDDALWFEYRAQLATWSASAFGTSSASDWLGLATSTDTWADDIDGIRIVDADSDDEYSHVEDAGTDDGDDDDLFDSESDTGAHSMRMNSLMKQNLIPVSDMQAGSFRLSRHQSFGNMRRKSSHSSFSLSRLHKTSSLESATFRSLHSVGSQPKLLKKSSSFGFGSLQVDNTSCLETIAMSIKLLQHLNQMPQVNTVLALDYTKGDFGRFTMSLFRPEHLFVHVDPNGQCVDLDLIECMLGLFHAMGLRGNEKDVEKLQDMLFAKKEREQFVRTSELCKGFDQIQHMFHEQTTMSSNEKNSQDNSFMRSSVKEKQLKKTLKAAAHFIGTFCSRDAHHLTKKSVSRSIVSRFRISFSMEETDSTTSDHEFEDKNISLEAINLAAPPPKPYKTGSKLGRFIRRSAGLSDLYQHQNK